MATQIWDSSYENIPADNDQASEGALRIRNLKRDVRERAEIDHDWDDVTDSGKHLQVTFRDPLGADPGDVTDEGVLYTKNVAGKVELFWKDEDGNVLQLSAIGKLPDAALEAISILTPAADRLPYFTSATAATLATFTAAGRAILDDADAAAQRTTLGLVIGTDVQAFDAVLDATTASFLTADETKLDAIEALADVTDVTNVTAAGALMDSEIDADLKTFVLPASTTISAFGKTLVDDAAASNARATLGVVIGTDVQAFDAGIDSLPSGTRMLFQQAAAPTGWTKDTTAGLDDHALRVVTTTAFTVGTNGTNAFSVALSTAFASNGYELLAADIPALAGTTSSDGAHTHAQHASTVLNTGAVTLAPAAGTNQSLGGNTGSAGAHTHTTTVNAAGGQTHAHDVDLDVKYLDSIVAAKD